MMNTRAVSNGRVRFGVLELLEFVTICAIFSAFTPFIGFIGCGFLMLSALALATRSGWLAIGMLAAASLAADVGEGLDDNRALQRQILILLLGTLPCVWFRIRGAWNCRSDDQYG